MRDVQGASLADVRAFYQTHYAPNNAVLAWRGRHPRRGAVILAGNFGAICPGWSRPCLTSPVIDGERRRVISTCWRNSRLMVG